MTAHPIGPSDDTEQAVLEAMRQEYEAQGFTFTTHPGTERLPPFMAHYRPDALAQKDGRNIAIEVMRPGRIIARPALSAIRQLFADHPDWQLRVVHVASDPTRSMAIPTATPARIRGGTREIVALSGDGHRTAAFVMSWSLLEAALRARRGEAVNPRGPADVVQGLAMNGYITLETERRLYQLVALRNRAAHGDLTVEPSAEDVEVVLSAIDETLEAETV